MSKPKCFLTLLMFACLSYSQVHAGKIKNIDLKTLKEAVDQVLEEKFFGDGQETRSFSRTREVAKWVLTAGAGLGYMAICHILIERLKEKKFSEPRLFYLAISLLPIIEYFSYRILCRLLNSPHRAKEVLENCSKEELQSIIDKLKIEHNG